MIAIIDEWLTGKPTTEILLVTNCMRILQFLS